LQGEVCRPPDGPPDRPRGSLSFGTFGPGKHLSVANAEGTPPALGPERGRLELRAAPGLLRPRCPRSSRGRVSAHARRRGAPRHAGSALGGVDSRASDPALDLQLVVLLRSDSSPLNDILPPEIPMDILNHADPEVFAAITGEEARQRDELEL